MVPAHHPQAQHLGPLDGHHQVVRVNLHPEHRNLQIWCVVSKIPLNTLAFNNIFDLSFCLVVRLMGMREDICRVSSLRLPRSTPITSSPSVVREWLQPAASTEGRMVTLEGILGLVGVCLK